MTREKEQASGRRNDIFEFGIWGNKKGENERCRS
jgi:hypothetical protein